MANADPTMPASLAAELREIKRRLDALERSPQIPFSSTRGGAFLFLDDAGSPRWAMGNVNLDGSISGITGAYGVIGYGDDGAITNMIREGDRGHSYPTAPFPFHDAAPKIITSPTFVGLWEARTELPSLEVLAIGLSVSSDADTTGEISLEAAFGGGQTDPLVIPAATNGFATFEWLHPAMCGLYDPRPGRITSLQVTIQARRTSGTGNITVFPPISAELSSLFLIPTAHTNGNPTLG